MKKYSDFKLEPSDIQNHRAVEAMWALLHILTKLKVNDSGNFLTGVDRFLYARRNRG